MKYAGMFLVLISPFFFMVGCATNPHASTAAQKPAPASGIKKEIIFPSQRESFCVTIENMDDERAEADLREGIIEEMKEKCRWKKPWSYYESRVEIRSGHSQGGVCIQARMDSALCPEKN